MNYIKQLTGFFQRMDGDNRLNPSHVSVYMALFQVWNQSHFRATISISRGDIMNIAKISSKATYHKVMRDLNDFGYLRYIPSNNPFKGSVVEMFDLSLCQKVDNRRTSKKTTGEPVAEPLAANNWTSTEPALVPSINNTNNTNRKRAKGNPASDGPVVLDVNNLPKTNIFDKPAGQVAGGRCTVAEAMAYFEQQQAPAMEAEKFYNYFESNGWMVGGKTAMRNWQAAARNWILNIGKYTSSNFNAIKDIAHDRTKNYSESL